MGFLKIQNDVVKFQNVVNFQNVVVVRYRRALDPFLKFICHVTYCFILDTDDEITRRSYATIGYRPDIVHTESIAQLQSENGHFASKDHHETKSVLDSRGDISYTSVDPEPSSAVSSTPHVAEHLDLVGPGMQESDEIDSDLDSLNSSLRSDSLFATQQSENEECQSVGEVTCDSIEATNHQEDNDERLIVTGSPVQCEEKTSEISQRAVRVIQKTGKLVRPLSRSVSHH